MRKLITLAALASLAAALTVSVTAGAAGSKTLIAKMTGEQEVPTKGDPDGKGNANIRLNAARERVCYTISTKRVSGIDAGHIHEAVRGEAGPVVIPLFSGETSEKVLKGCVPAEASVIREILANPSDYYVNIHDGAGTRTFPGGALRGQLRKSNAGK